MSATSARPRSVSDESTCPVRRTGGAGDLRRPPIRPEALKKIILDVKQRRAEQEAKGEKSPQLYHVIANEYVEFVDKDYTRIHSYWQTLFVPADPKSRPQVAAAGRGIDELVRLKGHWLIRKRDVMPPAAEW